MARRIDTQIDGLLRSGAEVVHSGVLDVHVHLELPFCGTTSADDYRTHYTRPVKLFYESLAGRPISEAEWLDLDRRFLRHTVGGVARPAS